MKKNEKRLREMWRIIKHTKRDIMKVLMKERRNIKYTRQANA